MSWRPNKPFTKKDERASDGVANRAEKATLERQFPQGLID
jgi:hypothetical protein